MDKYITILEAQEMFMDAFYLFKDKDRAIQVLNEYKDILDN